MKRIYSISIVVVSMMVLISCQMVKLPFLKDQQKNKIVETKEADDGQINAATAQDKGAENMDPDQPGIAENADISPAHDSQEMDVTAQTEDTQNLAPGQPESVPTAGMAQADDGQGNDVNPQAEWDQIMEPSQPDYTENPEMASADEGQERAIEAQGQEKQAETIGLDQAGGAADQEGLEKELPSIEAAHSHISRSYVALGRAYLKSKQIDEAKSALKRAMDHDENCQECPALLADCRKIEGEVLRREGENLIRAGQFDDAADMLERALALNSDDALASDLLFQAHYQNALELYDTESYLKAKTEFEKAVAVKPSCTDCRKLIEDSLEKYKQRHYNEGINYFGQENLKQAISSWEKVVAIDPDYKNVRENLRRAILMNERIEMIKQHTGE
ncbi:tetratricopeptide repeat protein [Desulfosarcina variabilis str. Montpellier]|uniref:tetratricopeptide repeat protein n=1 Tax=Desulfosarcina variabilis TaxID=2300 RepID=UPI003AFADD95